MRQRVAVAALLIVAAPLAILCGRGRPSRRCRRWLARLLRAPPLPPDRTLLQRIHTVVYDCDGVLYQNAQAVPGVPESLARMRSSGKRLLFVTNAASSSRASLAAKLGQLGIGGVRPDDCITSAYAAATFLATMHPDVKSAYVVGGGGLLEELRAAGEPGHHGGCSREPSPSCDRPALLEFIQRTKTVAGFILRLAHPLRLASPAASVARVAPCGSLY
jgi:hypothetical protein